MTKTTESRRSAGSFRRLTAVAAALCIVIALGTGVYAAGTHFGILDFSKHHPEQITDDAAGLIMTDIEPEITSQSCVKPFSCGVLEALCDSETITVVYEVSARERGKFLFIPTDMSPSDTMANCGYSGDMTAGEYADANGLEIVSIGGGICNTEELGIACASLDFHPVENDVMDVYVRCGKDSNAPVLNVECMATARPYSDDPDFRATMTFTLNDEADSVLTEYHPLPDSPSNGVFEIRKVDIIQTPLATYADICFVNLQSGEPDEALHFRVLDGSGKALEFTEGGGIEALADGTLKERFCFNKTALGGSIAVQGVDAYDGTVYGTFTLTAG